MEGQSGVMAALHDGIGQRALDKFRVDVLAYGVAHRLLLVRNFLFAFLQELLQFHVLGCEFLNGHLANAPLLSVTRQVVFLAVLVYPPADRIGPYSEFLGYMVCGLL